MAAATLPRPATWLQLPALNRGRQQDVLPPVAHTGHNGLATMALAFHADHPGRLPRELDVLGMLRVVATTAVLFGVGFGLVWVVRKPEVPRPSAGFHQQALLTAPGSVAAQTVAAVPAPSQPASPEPIAPAPTAAPVAAEPVAAAAPARETDPETAPETAPEPAAEPVAAPAAPAATEPASATPAPDSLAKPAERSGPSRPAVVRRAPRRDRAAESAAHKERVRVLNERLGPPPAALRGTSYEPRL